MLMMVIAVVDSVGGGGCRPACLSACLLACLLASLFHSHVPCPLQFSLPRLLLILVP